MIYDRPWAVFFLPSRKNYCSFRKLPIYGIWLYKCLYERRALLG